MSSSRYTFVDALRGIAALLVMFHHLLHCSPLRDALFAAFPSSLTSLFTHGAQGVYLFFVLSGFVIAHSLRDRVITVEEAGRFILRRQLRLDPPYWTVAGAVLILALCERFLGFTAGRLPSFLEVLVNVFYLQHIVGIESILPVAWTLCIEIQFYLLFIGLLLLGNSFRRNHTASPPALTLILLAAFAGLSFFYAPLQKPFFPWFLPFWGHFVAGVFCKWQLERRLAPPVFLGFMICYAAAALYWLKLETFAGFSTALALYVVGQTGRLTTAWSAGLLQYFGRISYSLYLIHIPVLSVVLGAGYKATGSQPAAALGWFSLAAITSIFVAHGLHQVVEVPSIRFSNRWRDRRPEPRLETTALVGNAP